MKYVVWQLKGSNGERPSRQQLEEAKAAIASARNRAVQLGYQTVDVVYPGLTIESITEEVDY